MKKPNFKFFSIVNKISFIVVIISTLIMALDKTRTLFRMFLYILILFICSLYSFWYQVYFYIKGDIENLHPREYCASIGACLASLLGILFFVWAYLTGKI